MDDSVPACARVVRSARVEVVGIAWVRTVRGGLLKIWTRPADPKPCRERSGLCPRPTQESVRSPGVIDHKAPGAVLLTTQNIAVASRQRHGFAVRPGSGEGPGPGDER